MGIGDESMGVRTKCFGRGWETMRGPALCRVDIPRQDLVVRLNGRDPAVPEDDYLPAVRPYGVVRLAWAIWREVPDVSPRGALSLALRVCREERAEVLVATCFLVEHVRGMLLARHHLVTHLECEW